MHKSAETEIKQKHFRCGIWINSVQKNYYYIVEFVTTIRNLFFNIVFQLKPLYSRPIFNCTISLFFKKCSIFPNCQHLAKMSNELIL